MTIQQRLIAVMKAKGYPQVTDTRTLKYVVFRRNDGAFYYLGKAGALRVGHTVAGSLSLSATKYLARFEGGGERLGQLVERGQLLDRAAQRCEQVGGPHPSGTMDRAGVAGQPPFG